MDVEKGKAALYFDLVSRIKGTMYKPPGGRLKRSRLENGGLKIHEPFMVMFHSFLVYRTVNACGLNAFMAKQLLYLLNRHAGIEQVSGACAAEPVGMDIFYICGGSNPVEYVLQPPAGKAFMGGFAAYKQSLVIVCTQLQVVSQVDMGSCIKVGNAFFIPFAEDDYIIFGKGNIRAVELQELRGPYSGAVKAFHDRKVPLRVTGGAEQLHLFGGQGLFYFFLAFNGVDGVNRISSKHPPLNEPFEKAVEDKPDLVKVGVADSAFVPVIVQVGIDIIVSDLGDILIYIRQKVGQVEPVKPGGAFGLSGLLAGLQVHLQIVQACVIDGLEGCALGLQIILA